MYFKTSYEQEFDDLYMHLKAKYPSKLFDLEGIGVQMDMGLFSKKFFSESTTTTADASVDANSNVDDMTIVAYENELPKPFARLNSLYLLWKYGRRLYGWEFANKLVEKELVGDYYINDLSNVQKPYCYNFSTYDIMTKGLPFVKKINSKPPKHLSSFCGQLVHFTSYASNQVMGAVGLADLLIVMSYYVQKELDENNCHEYIWRQVKQEIQSLIYSMNQPFRGGLQSGFYNISVYDDYFLDSLQEDYVFPNGKTFDKELVKKLQDIYLDLMNETMEISPITFPVTTACFCVDEDKNILDKKFLEYISRKNQQWAYINIYAGETSTLSSCCRLRSNKDNQYLGYSNSFGSGGTQIGSFGVVTLNLPKVAIQSKGDKDKFFEILKENAEYAIKINHIKRSLLLKRINKNALPLYDYGFMDIQKQYATIGLTGVYECISLMDMSLLEEDGQGFLKKVLQELNEMNDRADKQYKYAHNLEQTPSENSAIKLASKDKLLKLQNQYDLYSNQFIPLVVSSDMLDRIKLQGMFDDEFSGGSIMHINCDSPVENHRDIMDMIETTVKMGCVYHAINYNLQRCKNNHMSVGKNANCPICGEPITDNYIRVVGFIVNVRNFHKTRRDEDYAKRQFYTGKNIGEI